MRAIVPSIVFVWTSLAACGAAPPGATTETETQAETETETRTVGEPADAERRALALHEWGLVDVDLATGVAELSAGPGRPARPVVARKPVIYAHLVGAERVSLDLRVRVPGGAILEHWPLVSAPGADSIAWRAEIARGVCAAGARGPVRDARAPACASADGFCEVHELPRYVTDDHDCIRTDAGPASLLFYRARVPIDALPLRVERAGDLRVRVTGAARPVLRISGGLTGPWPAGRLVITRSSAGEDLTVGTEVVDPAAERAAMERVLLDLGLTGAEAQVFLDTWAPDLFGGAQREAARRSAPAAGPQDVLLYWLTPGEVERIAPLEASIPIEARRAWLVRLSLGAVATAGPAAP